MKKKLIIVGGPTASGKTKLAIEIAKKTNTEIISFDSRQIYKEMSIGTAKPSSEELAEVSHHFINHKSIHDDYSAGEFEIEAIELITKLHKKYDELVLVGGTGLYLDAILYGLEKMPEVNQDIKNDLIQNYKEKGIHYLQNLLETKDPEYYSEVDKSNPIRLLRALEIIESSGKKYSELRTGKKAIRDFSYEIVIPTFDRKELYERINSRVVNMFHDGLVEEVKSLIQYRNYNALQTVGYTEVFEYLDSKISMIDCISKVQQNTRRYAKRQITWFKKYQI